MDKPQGEEGTSQNPEVEETPEASQDEFAQQLAELEEKNRQMYERTKKAEQQAKEAKEELESLTETNVSTDEVYSDEGLALKKQIDSLQETIKSQSESKELDSVYSKHPILKDKEEEFNEFREQHPSYKVSDVAKLFLVDKDLLGASKTRKGLEKPTGGTAPSKPSGMTAEEVKDLRENNFRRYQSMLEKGTLKIADD